MAIYGTFEDAEFDRKVGQSLVRLIQRGIYIRPNRGVVMHDDRPWAVEEIPPPESKDKPLTGGLDVSTDGKKGWHPW